VTTTKTKKRRISSSKLVRLNKFLADHGVASRRKADTLIDEGKVLVNGKKVFELGIKIDPTQDSVKVSGKVVKHRPEPHFYVFNKPKHVVTTNSDPEGRVTVMDYFAKIKARMFPVGRLDWDTEGLLIITNDGEFANSVSSPKAQIPKTYHAKLDGIPTEEKLNKLRRGVSIVGGKVKPLEVVRLSKGTDKKAWIQVTIAEGKNRQVRKMFLKIGFDVVKLKRVAIGRMKLSGLKSGEFRKMTLDDMERIFQKENEKIQVKKPPAPRRQKSTKK